MLKAIGKIGAGTIGAMLATFVGLPLLTRLYDPPVYSAWIVFFSAWAVFSTVATLRLELAVVLPGAEEKQNAASLWIACLLSSMVVGALAWLVVHLADEALLGIFWKDLKGYLPWLAVWVFATGCYQACLGWFTRTERFGCYAVLAQAFC